MNKVNRYSHMRDKLDKLMEVLAYLEEDERENIRSRQAEGIAAAKARGVAFGRPAKKPPENFGAVVEQWESGKIKLGNALEQTGLKEATFYNRLREYRQSRKGKGSGKLE